MTALATIAESDYSQLCQAFDMRPKLAILHTWPNGRRLGPCYGLLNINGNPSTYRDRDEMGAMLASLRSVRQNAGHVFEAVILHDDESFTQF